MPFSEARQCALTQGESDFTGNETACAVRLHRTQKVLREPQMLRSFLILQYI